MGGSRKRGKRKGRDKEDVSMEEKNRTKVGRRRGREKPSVYKEEGRRWRDA